MTYYCKRHRDPNTFTFEGPDEVEAGFHDHHLEVHGKPQDIERRMGIL